MFDDLAISCGVAGGLRDDVPTGAAVIPHRVTRPDGSCMECDAPTVRALTDAALELGYRVVHDPLVTTMMLVHGAQRASLAARGYAAADMETGLIRAPRVACVRVILDTPAQEISPLWLEPLRALLHPPAWSDLPFLMREGPRCAAAAARIAARSLR